MTSPLVADGSLAREGGPERPLVQVAVGVLIQADGRFLLTSRPPGTVYAGYWEFPGGKLEAGERVAQALGAEMAEDLGIRISVFDPLETGSEDQARNTATYFEVMRRNVENLVGVFGG